MKQSTAKLGTEQHQALFTSIVQSSQDAIISKDINGNITSWNRAAEHLLEYSEAEVFGKHISIIIPEDRIDEEDSIIASILKGEKISNLKTVRKKKSGMELDVSLTISPLYDVDGKIFGASKILRDITQQLCLEQQLQETNLALQKNNMFKDEFIALLGHELKTPLTSLKACIELIERVPERKEDLLQKSKRHVNTLAKMLTELVDLAQSQAGRMEIHPAKVNALDFVKSAIEIAQTGISSHQIELHTQHPEITINADYSRMEQVVLNLLTNAVKYSPGADKVIVSISKMDGHIEISVKDFGLGIPAKEIENVGTRFYRVSIHKRQIKGLGIGLHLCKQLINAHKGNLWIESEEGVGSSFYVRLPIPVS